jgi:hypothetical protein
VGAATQPAATSFLFSIFFLNNNNIILIYLHLFIKSDACHHLIDANVALTESVKFFNEILLEGVISIFSIL